MRICLFTPTFFPRLGGAEVVIDALARQFLALGHEPVVLAPRDDLGPPPPLPYRVELYRKPVMPRWRPERLSSSLDRLHAEKPLDVVAVVYGQPTGCAAIRFRESTGVPVVLTCQGGDLYRHGATRRSPHRWRRVVEAYRQADAVIAISPYTEQLIREIAPEPRRLIAIPNGVDVDEITRPAERPADYTDARPFCLCLGNLIPQKGFGTAIEAMARARAELGDLQMVIVGRGRLEDELKQRAVECGVADRVHFAGQRTGNDKRWFIQNARFGVMPSREEAFGIVALEFLAASKLLICSTCSAFDPIYRDGVNALRVEAENVEALASSLVRADRNEWPAVAQMSRKLLEPYTWPVIARQYLDAFETVIHETTPALSS